MQVRNRPKSPGWPTLPVLALFAAALAVLSAVPALAATPAVTPPSAAFTPADGDFYTPPPNVGDYANGAIIRYQDSVVAYLGVPAKRIMYRSNDVHGAPVGVTGTLLEPTAPWNGPGPGRW